MRPTEPSELLVVPTLFEDFSKFVVSRQSFRMEKSDGLTHFWKTSL